MNLRTFHLVFIACASALAVVFGLWALGSGALAEAPRIVAAILSFGVAAGLIVYERWFLRYSRRSR